MEDCSDVTWAGGARYLPDPAVLFHGLFQRQWLAKQLGAYS